MRNRKVKWVTKDSRVPTYQEYLHIAELMAIAVQNKKHLGLVARMANVAHDCIDDLLWQFYEYEFQRDEDGCKRLYGAPKVFYHSDFVQKSEYNGLPMRKIRNTVIDKLMKLPASIVLEAIEQKEKEKQFKAMVRQKEIGYKEAIKELEKRLSDGRNELIKELIEEVKNSNTPTLEQKNKELVKIISEKEDTIIELIENIDALSKLVDRACQVEPMSEQAGIIHKKKLQILEGK